MTEKPRASGAKDIAEAIEQSVVPTGITGSAGSALSFVYWLAGGSEIISPWWSRQRDAELRRYFKQVDYLSGAVFTMEAMLTTIPLEVRSKNQNVRAWVKQAEEFTDLLINQSEFGDGWTIFYSKWVEDLVTQDNGAFAEIIGDGDPDGPIKGRPLGLKHLDSWRCQRTGDPDFPVLYRASDGKFWKIHRTRVIFTAQMPSPAEEMYGVGFCAISRVINVAQNLLDTLIYKQEKLGSRPHRGIIVTGGGLDPEDVQSAFTQAQANMTNQRLTRFSKMVVVGRDDMPDATLDLVDLAGLPDGFDEEQAVTLGMATIALAFGVDPRELFPTLGARATRAEALISHIKQRGKAPGQIIQTTERLFSFKFLPPHLELIFDFQDDAQDAQHAEIQNTRSTYHMRDIETGVVDSRTVREQMLEDGDLSRAQFERLELEDGRLDDGSEVIRLFFDPEFAPDLDLGVENPLDTDTNLASEMLAAIAMRKNALLIELNGANTGRKSMIIKALAALDQAQLLYGGLSARLMQGEQPVNESEPDDEEPEDSAEDMTFDGDDLDLKSNGRGKLIDDAAIAVRKAATAIAHDGR